MYNIYQYQENVRHQETQRLHDESFTKWMIRHEQLKNKSVENMKQRVTHFVQKQSENPSVVEDDHYKTWRYHRQYRDVEDSNKFVGFKTFRHKPNYDVGKHFTERERKQISYLANKSKMLIDEKLIPHEHLSRSLRSQGPLNPNHTFRERKPDHQLLQPRMRYTNITDKQRFLETSITFDDKFKNVYKNFSENKSQIGQTKISPIKEKDKNYQLDMMSSTFSENGRGKDGFYYQANNEEQSPKLSSKLRATNMSGSDNSAEKAKKIKTYFKTAKTMALHGDHTAKNLMIESQYDRKKDLTNINKNNSNEVYVKRPIL